MKFRNTITALCLFGSLMCGAQSTGNSAQSLFPYPQAPDELTTLQERASYLVSHFWDRCNMQSAILNRDAFKGAFMDYISFLPYAQADTVHNSISRLIAAYEKAPDKLLTLAELAEDAVYNGNADYISDEIFLPFANAVVNNKKISKTNKARIAHEAKVLTQTQVGQVAPELKYTLSDGTTSTLSSTRGAHVLLFVNDPDCDECRMTRIRLSADHNINQLLDEGLLRSVSIYPDDYSADWAQSVANYNSRWMVAATPDVEDEYDLRSTPALYYLNPEGVILSKTLDPDSLLEAFHVVNSKMTH